MIFFSLLPLFLFFVVPINLCGQDYTTYAENKLFPFLQHNPHWKNLIKKSINHCTPMQTEGVHKDEQLLNAKVCIKVYAALFRQQLFAENESTGGFESVSAHNAFVTTLKRALVSYRPASDCTNETTFMESQKEMRQVLKTAWENNNTNRSSLVFEQILKND